MFETKSSVKTKPVNVFYVWYAELCRRLNSNPVPVVKPSRPKCQTVLDFVADRLKVEEWSPVINALYHDTSLHVVNIRSRLGNCPFLHDIDTEEKAKRMKRKYGSLFTAFVLKSLLKSVSHCLRNTEVLTCLELDGIPIFSQYLEPLLLALKKNKTIKSLSFPHCPIKDIGCQMVCEYLRFTPNVEVLNFSDCGLSSESGIHLGKLIKYQQINRYCESWHNSLRYEDPESANMRGLKRITLNCNPLIGDEGFNCILNELEDDLWIKALDVQKCGITDKLANRILEITENSRSLEIVDLRQNDGLTLESLERILKILKDKQPFDFQPEFQWCNTAISISYRSIHGTNSKLSNLTTTNTMNDICKNKSLVLKNSAVASRASILPWEKILKKVSATTNGIYLNNGIGKSTTHFKIEEANQKVMQLNSQLQMEVKKRKEIEKKNEQLQFQLRAITGREQPIAAHKKISKMKITENRRNGHKNGFAKRNGFHHRNGGITQEVYSNGFRNYQNGVTSNIINNACKIFEKLLMKDKVVEEDAEEKDLLNYYKDSTKVDKGKHGEEEDSQVSLLQFIEELKNCNVSNGSVPVSKKVNSSKYYLGKYK